MTRSLAVVLAQTDPASDDVWANVAELGRHLAAHPDADLLVLPELSLTGYDLANVEAVAQERAGDLVTAVRDMAAQADTAVVVGLVERDDRRLFDSVLCVGRDGAVAGWHRKTHLFGAQSRAFDAGDVLECVEIDGVRVAIMVCFEMEFPEVGRTLAAERPDLLLTVAANMRPYADEHRLAARSRALESRLPLVYVNRVGAEAGMDFVGESCVVDPRGTVLASAGSGVESVWCLLELGQRARPEVDYRRFLRPDLYRVVRD